MHLGNSHNKMNKNPKDYLRSHKNDFVTDRDEFYKVLEDILPE